MIFKPESNADGENLMVIPLRQNIVTGSATDEILSNSRLLRQRIEARKNQPSTAPSPSKSSNSSATQFDLGVKIQSTEQNDSFPMLIGHLEETRKESFFTNVILVCVALFALPILPFVVIHHLFQQWSFKREYAQNILNPAYLRGTGLMVNSNLSAELITKRKVPRYVFEKEDITCINLHKFHTGLIDIEFELRIHLHDFHALTLYGFSGADSRDIVGKLVSLYDVEVHHTSEYVDSGHGGGGG